MYRGLLLGIVVGLAQWTSAATRQYTIPLVDGKASAHAINAPISQVLHLPNYPEWTRMDLARDRDALYALNACLWPGCSLEVHEELAILRLQEPKPENMCRRMSRMTRIVTAENSPAATAAQARHWGLTLPEKVDPSRPLIVLIHGLDGDRHQCMPMGELLASHGYQVAYFSYPGDQPIHDSSQMLAQSMRTMHARYPAVRLSFVCHSMGCLVARDYVEGSDYLGNLDRLILIAPPNHGSKWARLRMLLSAQENYYLCKFDRDWHWTWLITEGMGEAGSDLLPKSAFLAGLNHRPRRSGVTYTIIAGNHSGVDDVESSIYASISHWFPIRTRTWWGFGSCYRGLRNAAEHHRIELGDSDGPVSIRSAKLKGVTDLVILPADHRSLFLPADGKSPAALPVVMNRLGSVAVARMQR